MTVPLGDLGLDGIAFAWFALVFVGFSLIMHGGPFYRRSLTAAVHDKRRIWMRNLAVRENRMMDVVLLQMLSASNTFFASTSVILLGGLAALLGSGERVQGLLERLPYVAKASPELFEMKILVLMALFIYAFFKFAWAFRLTHYTAIMIGATPATSTEPTADCLAHSDDTAYLAGLSAQHANAGLRAYYFAIAGIAWFLHPVLFMLATTWVLVILARREFRSRSRRAILGLVTPRGPGG